MGPVRNPEIEAAVLGAPGGVRCVIDHRFTIADARNAEAGKTWRPVADGSLELDVTSRAQIADWVILLGAQSE